MTLSLQTAEIVAGLEKLSPGSVTESVGNIIVVKPESLYQVLSDLKTSKEWDFNYLNFVTAVDYQTYFEVVYNIVSLEHNHEIFVKTRLADREKPVLSSVYNLWKGADFQERELFDLFGIGFTGHPNMKRIFLWDGFQGYPLRKDFKQS
jgi:NADH-quinone oxidoreductase subunit C